MKIVIFGSRGIEDIRAVESAMEACGMASLVTEIVSGGARGVDRLGERYARQYGILCKIFPAQWAKYGKSAGPLRNAEMAKYADYGVAVWDGVSRGTAHMLKLMEGRVFVVIYCHTTTKNTLKIPAKSVTYNECSSLPACGRGFFCDCFLDMQTRKNYLKSSS